MLYHFESFFEFAFAGLSNWSMGYTGINHDDEVHKHWETAYVESHGRQP